MHKEKDRLEKFKRYGWKCNEANLDTLPTTAPQAARDLAQWLTLEGRRSSLEEWVNCVSDKDSKVHGKFWHIGAWTQRMSHSSPNQANIPSVFTGKAETAVQLIKEEYDGQLRELFMVPEGSYLVGCDAEGIQLRILAHYMKSAEYRDAIVEGKKEDESDIHNVNKKALGSICKTRDGAKTFIYAWVLGAGLPKIASILSTNVPQAKKAVDNFLKALPELKRLKQVKIKRDAMKGYFTALDGRKVLCNSEHLMLAGYLQSGEAIIMKRATRLWYAKAKHEGIKFKLVNLVHDEWQVEVNDTKEKAERLGVLMCEALEQVGKDLDLFCPLAGNYVIGTNWKETH